MYDGKTQPLHNGLVVEHNTVTPKEAWENLADAVVWQAAEDYRTACCVLRRRPKNLDAAIMKAEAECFFRGGEFSVFTAVPGEVILQML